MPTDHYTICQVFLRAHPGVRESYCPRKLVSLSFSPESKSTDSAVLLMLPPHVEGGSDHIWTWLPSLDAHFRSHKKGVRGVAHVCMREGHCTNVCNPGAQLLPLF